MKIATHIAAVLLGLVFLLASVPFLLNLVPEQKLPDGAVTHFMAAFGPTGYMTFIKVLELLGAILVIIPQTRNFGLLILGPIILNILAFHVFVTKGLDASNLMAVIMLVLIVVLPLFLLWVDRRRWLGLLR
jgi:putative oxidoreductase